MKLGVLLGVALIVLAGSAGPAAAPPGGRARSPAPTSKSIEQQRLAREASGTHFGHDPAGRGVYQSGNYPKRDFGREQQQVADWYAANRERFAKSASPLVRDVPIVWAVGNRSDGQDREVLHRGLFSFRFEPAGQTATPVPRLSRQLAVFNELPRNDTEFRNVYAHSASVAEIARFAEASRRTDQTGTRQETFDAAMASAATVIVIVGHNNGGNLRTRSGELLSLEDLSARCEAAGKVCVFLSCHAQDWVSRAHPAAARAISAAEAARSAESVAMILRGASGNVKGEIADPSLAYRQLFFAVSRDRQVRYYYRQVSNVAVILLVAIGVQCDNECPPFPGPLAWRGWRPPSFKQPS